MTTDDFAQYRHVARAGHVPSFDTPPSSPPIYQTAAFDIPDPEFLAAMRAGEASGYVYTRDGNPNHAALAATIAKMENAEAGAVFASGMGAIAAVLLSLAGTGDHIVASRLLYGRTSQLLERFTHQFGIEVSSIDVGNPDAVKAAVRANTRLCLVETISNPLLDVVDIAAVANALGRIPLVVDSTFTTPELIRPLDHGASVVIHSASKYLNGHGDVMLGVAAGSGSLMKSAAETASQFGQNANPFESWLTQRGLRTLPLRMKQICETTNRLAKFLAGHPCVRRVCHPAVNSHPGYDTARRLYPNGTGGIISILLADDSEAAVARFMRAAEQIPFSPTLADARTTVSHPASTSHRYMTVQQRTDLGITAGLMRLSVGLEPFELLRHELDQALRNCS
ncbi:MAG: aminotransferase class I/II-fold pyridoxal phosphate-dependent enzyme [Planctomycetaceae bacterium]